MDPRIENNRRRRAVATLAQTDNMMHFTTSRTCCTRRIYCTLRRSKGLVTFLQRFFDNEASVRFQTVLVLVLVFHGCALALTATTLKTAALNTLPVRTCGYGCVFWWLVVVTRLRVTCCDSQVFLFCFGTEILLRLFAEGPGDFWYVAHSLHAWHLCFFKILPVHNARGINRTFYRLNSVEGQSRGSYRAQALRFDCCITTGVLLAYGIMKIFDLVCCHAFVRVCLWRSFMRMSCTDAGVCVQCGPPCSVLAVATAAQHRRNDARLGLRFGGESSIVLPVICSSHGKWVGIVAYHGSS